MECEDVDWIELARGRVRSRVHVNTVHYANVDRRNSKEAERL